MFRDGTALQLRKILALSAVLYCIGGAWALSPSPPHQTVNETHRVISMCAALPVGVWLGLQFTALDYIPSMQRLVLNAHALAQMPCIAKTVLGLSVVLAIALAVWSQWLLWASSVAHAIALLAGVGCAALAVFVATKVMSPAWYFHLHHWALFGLGVAFTGVPGQPWMTLICGIMFGSAVEGAARWGLHPVFESQAMKRLQWRAARTRWATREAAAAWDVLCGRTPGVTSEEHLGGAHTGADSPAPPASASVVVGEYSEVGAAREAAQDDSSLLRPAETAGPAVAPGDAPEPLPVPGRGSHTKCSAISRLCYVHCCMDPDASICLAGGTYGAIRRAVGPNWEQHEPLDPRCARAPGLEHHACMAR